MATGFPNFRIKEILLHPKGKSEDSSTDPLVLRAFAISRHDRLQIEEKSRLQFPARAAEKRLVGRQDQGIAGGPLPAAAPKLPAPSQVERGRHPAADAKFAQRSRWEVLVQYRR
jgi:hypothetical protein